MRVRNICRESANQSRLLGGDKFNSFNALVHFGGNKRAHGAFALATIKIAPVFGQHLARAARARIHRSFGGFFIYTVADANDHENDLQHVRMIVKCDANGLQLQKTEWVSDAYVWLMLAPI